jgi:hypothetical protein
VVAAAVYKSGLWVISADLWLGHEHTVNLPHGSVDAAFTKYTREYAKLDFALAGPTFDAVLFSHNWPH